LRDRAVTPRKRRASPPRRRRGCRTWWRAAAAAPAGADRRLRALEPRLLGAAGFRAAHVDAVVAGLVRFQWPVAPDGAAGRRLLRAAGPRQRPPISMAARSPGSCPAASPPNTFGRPVIVRPWS
jgi:hypothetical protein